MYKQRIVFLLAIFMFLNMSLQAEDFINTRIYNMSQLAKVKVKINTPEYSPAYISLLASADKKLKATPPSVMQKEMIAPSGDKHDYISMGPYWWADPEKPDGLPYIRKDGQRNPELDQLDRNKLGNMAGSVVTLGLAYYFSDNEKYAKKAVDYLRVWFLNKDTKMNPHLTYGQIIPGRNNGMGRGAGLIDTYSFVAMLDAVEILKRSKHMTEQDQEGLKNWFSTFVDWMQTSPVAKQEEMAKNNHGLAFDVQLTVYALFTGNQDLAREILMEFPEKRLFTQIEPDGRQPLELERTIAFSYTVFNLNHMIDMAETGLRVGMDVYTPTSPDGRSITAALHFMKQYVGKPQSEWPYQQIKEWDEQQNAACWILHRASFLDSKKGYDDYWKKYCKTPSDDILYLLYSWE